MNHWASCRWEHYTSTRTLHPRIRKPRHNGLGLGNRVDKHTPSKSSFYRIFCWDLYLLFRLHFPPPLQQNNAERHGN